VKITPRVGNARYAEEMHFRALLAAPMGMALLLVLANACVGDAPVPSRPSTDGGPPPPSDAAPASDAGTLDAALAVDAKSMAACPLPSFVQNGGFEMGMSPWTPYPVGSLPTDVVTNAHNGIHAYKICSTAGIASLTQKLSAVSDGKAWVRAWARTASEAFPPQKVRVEVGNAKTTSFSISSAWSCVEGEVATYAAAKTMVYLDVNDSVDAGPACAVFDDVDVWAVPDGGMPPECKCPP
jgi:hypothetical protein